MMESEILTEKDECLNAVVKLTTSPEFCRIKWKSTTICLDAALVHVHRTSKPTKDIFDFKYHQCFLDKCNHSFCDKENCSFNHESEEEEEEESERESEPSRRLMSSENYSQPEWCPAVHDYLKRVLRPCCSVQMKTFKNAIDNEPPTVVDEIDVTCNLYKKIEKVKKEEVSPINDQLTKERGNGQNEFCRNETDTNDKNSDSTYIIGADLHEGYLNYLNKTLKDFIDINSSKQNETTNDDKIYNLISGITNSTRDERIFHEFRRAFSEAVERIQNADLADDKKGSKQEVPDVPSSGDPIVSEHGSEKKGNKQSDHNDDSDFRYTFKNHCATNVDRRTKKTKKKNKLKSSKQVKNSKDRFEPVVSSNIDDSYLEDCLKHVYIGSPCGSHLQECYCYDCSKHEVKERVREKKEEIPSCKVSSIAIDYINGCRTVSSQACLSKSPLKITRKSGRPSRKLRKIVTSDKTIDFDIGINRLSKKETELYKSSQRKKPNVEPSKESKTLSVKNSGAQKKTNEETLKANQTLAVNSIRSRTSYETCPPIISRESTSSTYDPRAYEYKSYGEAKRFLRKC